MQPERKRLKRQRPPRNDLAITIRMPHELHQAIKRKAKPKRLSLNAQFVHMLEFALENEVEIEAFRQTPFIAREH